MLRLLTQLFFYISSLFVFNNSITGALWVVLAAKDVRFWFPEFKTELINAAFLFN